MRKMMKKWRRMKGGSRKMKNNIPEIYRKLGILSEEDLVSYIFSGQTASDEILLGGSSPPTDEQLSGLMGAIDDGLMNEIKSFKPKIFSTGLIKADPFNHIYPLTIMEYDTLPDTVFLGPELTYIKDQANRGTCVAHSTIAAVENFFFKITRMELDLSEQYLYYWCKEKDDFPGQSGTSIKVAFECSRDIGNCEEHTWPYYLDDIPGNEGQGPPPDDALIESKKYRIPWFNVISCKDIEGICAILSRGIPISFGVPTFSSWDNNSTYKYGRIFMPLPGDEKRGGHAMLLVGYQLDNNYPGGGSFIFRNSWGESWGYACQHGSGYGTIPFQYIIEHSNNWLFYFDPIKEERINDVKKEIEGSQLKMFECQQVLIEEGESFKKLEFPEKYDFFHAFPIDIDRKNTTPFLIAMIEKGRENWLLSLIHIVNDGFINTYRNLTFIIPKERLSEEMIKMAIDQLISSTGEKNAFEGDPKMFDSLSRSIMKSIENGETYRIITRKPSSYYRKWFDLILD